MEFTDFFQNPVPPLIHGEFDTTSGREVEQLDAEKGIRVQKMSAAELNFRSDIFSSSQSSSSRIDSGVLAKAARFFLEESILGQSFEEYCGAVSRTSRIPVSTAKAAAAHLAEALKNVSKRAQSSRRKNSFFFDDLNGLCSPTYGLIQVRKGDNVSVSLPGNGPGPNSVWVEALLYGYEVILRPSFRDIFTPLRLAICLIRSGVPGSCLSVIFCDYLGHNTLVERSDLSLIFGGQDLESKYQEDTNVKVYGPGRSITLLDPELYSSKIGGEIINSVIDSSGVACFNTSLLLLTQPSGDFEQTFISDLTSAMDKRKFIGKDDRPTIPRGAYHEIVSRTLMGNDAKILYDGSTSLNETEVRPGPLIYTRNGPTSSQDILEFPFPAVELSSLRGVNIEKVVNKSLSTAIYSNDSGLIYKVFHCRPGGRVLINTNRTTDFDRLPHDGHLSDFLLTERPFVKSLD